MNLLRFFLALVVLAFLASLLVLGIPSLRRVAGFGNVDPTGAPAAVANVLSPPPAK
ncbi:MAG: hypothetical protein L6R43_18420 [Planctomycetes bacterium]|nr:hypothetical protein [Planctomycetota bacterium]